MCASGITERWRRIEVGADEFSRLNQPALRASISARLREAGFRFVCVDLDGYDRAAQAYPERVDRPAAERPRSSYPFWKVSKRRRAGDGRKLS